MSFYVTGKGVLKAKFQDWQTDITSWLRTALSVLKISFQVGNVWFRVFYPALSLNRDSDLGRLCPGGLCPVTELVAGPLEFVFRLERIVDWGLEEKTQKHTQKETMPKPTGHSSAIRTAHISAHITEYNCSRQYIDWIQHRTVLIIFW